MKRPGGRPALALPGGSVLSCLSGEDLQRIVEAAPEERLGAGERLMAEGEAGDCAFLILQGRVAIDVAGELGSSTVASLGPGDLVGELSAFADSTRIATVTAETDLRVLRIERALIREILSHSPELGMSLIAALGARIQASNSAIATLTRAARALADGKFDPAMLDTLSHQADQLAHFAEAFRTLAGEMREKRRLAQEMETAEAIQRAFLPDRVPSGPLAERFEVAASMTPARNVGGDFYDFFMLEEGRLAFAIGDVSGKGIPAAIFMSYSRIVLRIHARNGGTAGAILGRVNDVLSEDNAESMFVTLALGLLDLETGDFEYASGGHEETFHLASRAGGLVQLGRTGPAIGLIPGARFDTVHEPLGPGDAVLFATDGVTEAFDAQRAVYGLERLRARLAGAPRESAAALVESVVDDVAGFVRAAPPSDDLTLVALVFRGAAVSREAGTSS